MSAQFYVQRAQEDIAPLLSRIRALGAGLPPESPTDVVEIASVVCDCEVLLIRNLSEQRALAVLETDYGVDVSDAAPTNAPLAGALCVASNGLFRWLLVNADDSPDRQRFTIAHELGHLVVEAEPELERAAAVMKSLVEREAAASELRVFSRCSETEGPHDIGIASSPLTAFSKQELRELRAHHFAAELLMPYEGVKRLIGRFAGHRGIRTQADRDRLVKSVATTYRVSMAAARRRIEKDLEIVPIHNHPNADLFS